MTDTPKDLHFAIWELLAPEERPGSLYWRKWCCTDGVHHFTQWWNDPKMEYEDSVLDFHAHLAILDAAREVLDLAGIGINAPQHNVSMGWWWCAPSMGWAESEEDYPTRTECIYHALKWLREGEK